MASISKSTASKSYNKNTVAKIKARDAGKSSSGGSSSKLSQLESVTAQAKALGIDTRKAESMIAQTKSQGSTAYKGSSFEKDYLSTIPANMTNQGVANIPTPPAIPNYGDVTGANNQAIVSVMGQGTTYDPKTGYIPPPQTQDNLKSLFDEANLLQNQAFQDMGTDEERMRKLEKENQLKQKQQAVNEYTGQLNSIVATSQAQQLALEGQGRGQTSSFVGGEQARINREAAIAALPVQAQLAAAQGALDMAQSHIDKMFQIQSNDALAKYNYTSKLIDSVYNFATGAEQRRLDAIKAKEDRAYEDKKTNLAYQRDLAAQATQSGQSSLAGSLMRLDPNSPTYSEDLAKLGGQVVDTTSALQRESLRANIAQSYSSIETEKLQQRKLLAELNPTNDESVDSDLVSYAQQYADTGKLPSVTELKNSNITVSQVTSYAKQVPKPDGVILSSNTGIKSSAISPAQEDGINALYDIKKKVAELKVLDTKRQKGLLSAGVGKIFGSDDQQRYIDLRGEIVDLLARARTGAALTIQEEKFYADQLPGRIGQVGVIPGTGAGLFGVDSQERITNFETKIGGTLDTKLSGNGLVIQGYSKVNVPQLGDKTVGEVIDIGGTQYRVLPDGTLTDVI